MRRSPLVIHEFGDPTRPPMVLLHGLTDAGTAWPDAVGHWGRSWRIIAPDQRGHGQSPRFAPSELPHMMDVFVADLLDLLRPLRRPVIVGHSLGGCVAVAAAGAQPDLIGALVLEDPALTGWCAAPQRFVDEELAALDNVASEHGAARTRELSRDTAWSASEIDAAVAASRDVDRVMIEHFHMGGLNPMESLNGLRVPTLLLNPVDSPLAPDPHRLSNPHVERHVLSDCGHCIRRDAPDRFYAAGGRVPARSHGDSERSPAAII